MEIAPGIRVIQIPEQNPMRPVSTNIYLVGDRELTMIDTGVQEDRYSQAMFGYLMGLGPGHQVTQAAITHSHSDHGGGLRWVRESLGPKLLAHPAAIPVVEPRVGKELMLPLQDGHVVEAEDIKLEVHYSPGHSVDSLCFYVREGGLLFTGDTILGVGTTTIKDLSDYMASLSKLLALQPKTICPGHGPVIHEATRAIQEYIAHRNMREEQIIQELRQGPKSAQRLVQTIYAQVDKRLHRAARGNVL